MNLWVLLNQYDVQYSTEYQYYKFYTASYLTSTDVRQRPLDKGSRNNVKSLIPLLNSADYDN